MNRDEINEYFKELCDFGFIELGDNKLLKDYFWTNFALSLPRLTNTPKPPKEKITSSNINLDIPAISALLTDWEVE